MSRPESYQTARKRVEGVFQKLHSEVGFVERPAQRRMATIILDTLVQSQSRERPQSNIAAIEAPTGTGKTLAYLISSVVAAQSLEKTLVVSTATLMLQKQIRDHDLPWIAEHAGLDVTYAMAKGRRRYLCVHKLQGVVQGVATQELSPDERIAGRMWDSFMSGGWVGELDTWAGSIPDSLSKRVTTTSAECEPEHCAHVEVCPYYRAREQRFQARVIVTNHDLVLSDLGLGGGVILPPPEEVIYVFDEAHHLPDKALTRSRRDSRIADVLELLLEATALVDAVAQNTVSERDAEFARRLQSEVAQAQRCAGAFQSIIEDLLRRNQLSECQREEDKERKLRLYNGKLPEDLRQAAMAFRDCCLGVRNSVAGFRNRLAQQSTGARHWREKLQDATSSMDVTRKALGRHCNVWSHWIDTPDNWPSDKPVVARWLLQSKEYGGDIGIALQPVFAAGPLHDQLWSRAYAAILTSATLTSLGRFDRLSRDTGLDGASGACFEALSSPFDYQAQATLRIPEMRFDPTDGEAYWCEVGMYLNRCINPRAGTLVLFNSWADLNMIHSKLTTSLKAITLRQGQMPISDILREHERQVGLGQGSVLFGVQSLAEGLDLRGNLCTHLVITRLPFSAPTGSPVTEAASEYLNSQGENPFTALSLEQVSIRLAQSVGRLIRSETDSGEVTILDRRILDKSYGPRLFASLPRMKWVPAEAGSAA